MFTGNKDLERENILKLDDRDFLSVCNVNEYYRNVICDDELFKRRLRERYPNTLYYKQKDISWRQYFLETMYYISKMEERLSYKYVEGNPKIQYSAYKRCSSFACLISESSEVGELPLLQFALYKKYKNKEIDSKIIFNIFKNAAKGGYLDMLIYSINLGAYIHKESDYALRIASSNGHLNIVKYLIDIGNYSIDKLKYALEWAEFNNQTEVVKYLKMKIYQTYKF